MRLKYIVIIVLDIFFLLLSIGCMIFLLPKEQFAFEKPFLFPLSVFIALWIFASLIQKKYFPLRNKSIRENLRKIILANSLILLIVIILLLLSRQENAKFIILGSILITSFLELLSSNFYFLIIQVTPSMEEETLGTNGFVKEEKTKNIREIHPDATLIKKIESYTSTSSRAFIFKNITNGNYTETLFIATTTLFNIENQYVDFENIVNLKRINDIQRINKFFESVNRKLPERGIFINCVETYHLRKERILKKYFWGLNYTYYCFDFIIKRILPKLILTKGIYFFLTRGQNRVISKAEVLGRLYSCGFEVIDEQQIDNLLYFATRKIKEPAYDMSPTYGPFIKLRRIGENGKIFNVYKLRTMHPYAEYLQNYVYQKNMLDEGGKFKNDFRITTLGKFFRKCWLDELPMFINLLNGEMKLVGVRPISQHYFNLYNEELKEKRIKTKPGLFPPFYLDMPKTLDEIMESELKYLNSYSKHPFSTDFIYFWKILYNIIFKKARSQ